MYKDRKTIYAGNIDFGHTVLKQYDISYSGDNVNPTTFSAGFQLAESMLKSEKSFIDSNYGFCIRHSGVREDYLVICYWANENECFIKVFIGYDSHWRPALDESFCVWDLKIIWFERESYVKHVLSSTKQHSQQYLSDYFEQNEAV